MDTQNFSPEKEVIELTEIEKLMEELADKSKLDNKIPTEESEEKDVPTVQ